MSWRIFYLKDTENNHDKLWAFDTDTEGPMSVFHGRAHWSADRDDRDVRVSRTLTHNSKSGPQTKAVTEKLRKGYAEITHCARLETQGTVAVVYHNVRGASMEIETDTEDAIPDAFSWRVIEGSQPAILSKIRAMEPELTNAKHPNVQRMGVALGLSELVSRLERGEQTGLWPVADDGPLGLFVLASLAKHFGAMVADPQNNIVPHDYDEFRSYASVVWGANSLQWEDDGEFNQLGVAVDLFDKPFDWSEVKPDYNATGWF